MNNTSIVICGEKFDIGTKVILWDDLKGFNGYDTTIYTSIDRKTGKTIKTSGKKYGTRNLLKPNPTVEQLKGIITQFFLHHTGNLKADSTFETLNERGLSVTFILDDNGDIYQTLDVKEKAWHGGTNNPMSIGIEICSRASASKFPNDYDEYHQEKYGILPRKKRIDKVQGMTILGYEYNDAQYASLIKLMATISKIFPNLTNADFPRSSSGQVIKSLLSNPLKHIGFICHYNTCKEKWDPVCMDHQRILNGMKTGQDMGTTFLSFDTFKSRQKALAILGYYKDVIDGIWGPHSKQAFLDFQKDNGFKEINWSPITDYVMDILIKQKG